MICFPFISVTLKVPEFCGNIYLLSQQKFLFEGPALYLKQVYFDLN